MCAIGQRRGGGVVETWEVAELVIAPEHFDGAGVVWVFGLPAQSQRITGTQLRQHLVAVVMLAAGDAAVLQVQAVGRGAHSQRRHDGKQRAAYAGSQGAKKTAPRV